VKKTFENWVLWRLFGFCIDAVNHHLQIAVWNIILKLHIVVNVVCFTFAMLSCHIHSGRNLKRLKTATKTKLPYFKNRLRLVISWVGIVCKLMCWTCGTRVSQTFSSANFGTPKPTKGGGQTRTWGNHLSWLAPFAVAQGFSSVFWCVRLSVRLHVLGHVRSRYWNVNEVDHIKKDIPNGYPLFLKK
jgi:hypothetical protein